MGGLTRNVGVNLVTCSGCAQHGREYRFPQYNSSSRCRSLTAEWRGFSELEPQRPLHPARVARRNQRSEARIGLPAGGVKAGACIHAAKLRVIEGVVHLPSQLE